MKDLLIIIGTIFLGCLLFAMIAGDKDSLKAAGSSTLEKTVKQYEEQSR